MGRSGNSARTRLNASATPPAAMTWLSLTRAASESDIRWLTPPPHRTAYFSSARSPAVVLRVSRTWALEPSSVSIAIVHETLSQNLDERVEFDEIADRVIAMVAEISPGKVTCRRNGRFGILDAEVATRSPWSSPRSCRTRSNTPSLRVSRAPSRSAPSAARPARTPGS
ncbi:hypothetical protein SCYAM73S_05469 [Streptomyces cyaneofuscatus]